MVAVNTVTTTTTTYTCDHCKTKFKSKASASKCETAHVLKTDFHQYPFNNAKTPREFIDMMVSKHNSRADFPLKILELRNVERVAGYEIPFTAIVICQKSTGGTVKVPKRYYGGERAKTLDRGVFAQFSGVTVSRETDVTSEVVDKLERNCKTAMRLSFSIRPTAPMVARKQEAQAILDSLKKKWADAANEVAKRQKDDMHLAGEKARLKTLTESLEHVKSGIANYVARTYTEPQANAKREDILIHKALFEETGVMP